MYWYIGTKTTFKIDLIILEMSKLWLVTVSKNVANLGLIYICGALYDLVPFVQFKKM